MKLWKRCRFLVKGMIQEGGISGGERPHQRGFFTQFVEQGGQNEGPGVVVGAVSLGKIGHGEDGVLENPGGVGHLGEMFQFYFRQLARLLVESLRCEQLSRYRGALEPSLFK